MTLTLKLPDSDLLDAALRFQALKEGYPSLEDYCIAAILVGPASEDDFDGPIAQLYDRWAKGLGEKGKEAPV